MSKTLVRIDPVKHFAGIIHNVSDVSLMVFNGEESVEIYMKNGNIYLYKFSGEDVTKALPFWQYCNLMHKHYNKDTKKYKIETPPINSMTVNKFKEILEEVISIERVPYLNCIDMTYDIIIYMSDRKEIHTRYSSKELQVKRLSEFAILLKKITETQIK